MSLLETSDTAPWDAAPAPASAADPDPAFRADVLEGLSARPKRLSPKFLYDPVGAKLFEAITLLDDYYPTRTERALFEAHGGEMADALGEPVHLIEPGSGDGTKAEALLDRLGRRARSYVPIDIAADQLAAVAERLAARYPALRLFPVAGDFLGPPALPDDLPREGRALFFPGSTLGNMEPDAARAFLERLRTSTGAARFLVGIDLEKDADTLVRAYDDPAGVTAAFDKNLLQRINRELRGTFDLSAFRHEARYDAQRGRIEMHLVSTRAQTASAAGRTFRFEAGETIHTENSYKYTVERFRHLAASAGWRPERVWTDPDEMFSVHLLSA